MNQQLGKCQEVAGHYLHELRNARKMTSNFAPWRPAGRKTRADILVRLTIHNCAE